MKNRYAIAAATTLSAIVIAVSFAFNGGDESSTPTTSTTSSFTTTTLVVPPPDSTSPPESTLPGQYAIIKGTADFQIIPRYLNCIDVINAGAAPIYWDDPGYWSGLDPDGDGVGCND